MFRYLTRLLLLFIPVCAMAQRPDGPLTITSAARARSSAVLPDAFRGGAPYNDSCQNAVVHPLPADGTIIITGDNTGSTDTEDFGNPVSWEAFTTDTCATVTVSYCGTVPLFELVYSILITGCPEFVASIQNSSTAFCEDGNVTITYEELAAGTYYIPVLGIAGSIGPYTITVISDVCDLPPLNDNCGNASSLMVVQDCAQGTVTGSNANAVINSAPPCATTQSQFQDVWYMFDSGTSDEVVITIDPGTISDIGVEVREACAGPSVFCATGDTSYTVAVEPGITYRVRLFSNNDFGFGGTFGICVSVPDACDAGIVAAIGGGGAVAACANGGDPIVFEQSGASGSGFALILTDAEDTIVAVLDGLVLDPNGLPSGDYHLWGAAFEGDLSGVIVGDALSGITSTEGCLDVSDAPLMVTIEICAGMMGAGAGEVRLSTTSEGTWLLWPGPPTTADVDLLDAHGAVVSRTRIALAQGQQTLLFPAGRFATGVYAVRIHANADPQGSRRVFVH